MKKKYYDGFIVHDILDAHLKSGKMLEVLKAFAEVNGVDAVKVIRCKDCKHRVLINHVWRCLYSDFIAPEHYCGYAERKE